MVPVFGFHHTPNVTCFKTSTSNLLLHLAVSRYLKVVSILCKHRGRGGSRLRYVPIDLSLWGSMADDVP